ncbi:unnamed protein product [Lactuca saligna]|uniref:UBL3-like ubiquitin domain-containing protein n=1 Tax=Lactuca saligna TaxID=75948 RepID=A0AA36E5L6_LACSI|nr:unnamed protein product [Lactuca saligna]
MDSSSKGSRDIVAFARDMMKCLFHQRKPIVFVLTKFITVVESRIQIDFFDLMSGVPDSLEIKFLLIDGSIIGPTSFPKATSVASLKENIISQWPEGKENAPRTIKDVKLISNGKVLENSNTVGECMSRFCDVPCSITTMHVGINQAPQEKVVKFKQLSHHSKCWGWATKRAQASKP